MSPRRFAAYFCTPAVQSSRKKLRVLPEQRLAHLTASAEKAFLKFGIKALSMLDIAGKLGVSKKTLYRCFSDKGDLVKRVITSHCENQHAAISELAKSSENAIDEIISITVLIQSKMRGMHPSLLFDLEKFHPEAFEIIDEHKNTALHSVLLKNLKRGQQEGMYRADFDPQLIICFHMAAIEYFTNPTHLAEAGLALSEVQGEHYRYHIRAIASEQGIAYLKTK